MKKIPLTQGQYALVDDEDFEKLAKYSWCVFNRKNKGPHAVRRKTISKGKSKIAFMHHEVMGVQKLTDHINGNGLDNRKSNLRSCTFSQNACNRPAQRTNKSGFKGVSFRPDKKVKQWSAEISFQGARKRLGYFLTAEEAFEAYKKAALELHGEFAKW